MGLFDSEFETFVSWDSSRIIEDNGVQYNNSILKRVIADSSQNDAGFYKNYAGQALPAKQVLRLVNTYARNGVYTGGIPDVVLSSADVSSASMESAIRSEFPAIPGGDAITVLGQNYGEVPFPIYYAHELMYNDPDGDFNLATDQITYDDDLLVTHTDWNFDSFDVQPDTTYNIVLSRDVDALTYWTEGPSHIVEGESAVFTIRLNRLMAVATLITFDIDITSTTGAVVGAEYSQPGAVTINAGEDEATFTITTLDNTVAEANHILDVALTVTAGEDSYSFVTPRTGYLSKRVVIQDRNTLILTMPEISVVEANTVVNIPVTVQSAAGGNFTVDAYTYGETGVADEDYVDSTTTLGFSGAALQTINFPVTILADALDDDGVTLNIRLKNCSDPAVDITSEGTIRITDGTEEIPPTNDFVFLTINKPAPPVEDGFYTLFTYTSLPQGEYEQFLYYPSTNTYPAITDGSVSNTLVAALAPIFNLRTDGIDINTAPESDLYKSTKQTMRLMNLDIETITEGYNQAAEQESIDEVRLNFRIPIGETNQYLSEALWKQFYEYTVAQGFHLHNLSGSVRIEQVGGTETNTWTKVNYYVDVALVKTNETKYIHDNVAYTPPPDPLTGGTVIAAYGTSGTHLTIYWQKTATTCDVIALEGLQSRLICTAPQVSDSEVEWAYHSSVENISFPLTWKTINDVAPFQLLQVYPYIYRFDITTVTVVTTKWYQQKWFKIILIVIRIVIAIFSWGSSETSGIASIVWNILYILLIQYAIGAALAFLVKQLGIDPVLAAAILVVVSAAIGAGGGVDWTSFLDAEMLLSMAVNFADLYVQGRGLLFQETLDDFDEFNQRADAAEEKIDKARESLAGSGVVLGPSAMIQQAIEVPYMYDLLFDYDRILSEYHSEETKVGIV